MKEENIQRFIDEYLDKESWIFTYTSEFTPRYIYLKDIVVLGSLQTRDCRWTNHHATHNMLYVDIFVKGGGQGRIVIRESSGYGRNLVEISEHDREYYEALLRSWKECKKVCQ